jgi:hypothetical protein
MGLLDVAIRGWGLERGMAWFPMLRDLEVAVAGPEQLVVSNTFIKIQRLKKNGPSDNQGTGIVGPLGATIAFRAFVQFGGPLRIAVALKEAAVVAVEPTKGRKGKPVDNQIVEPLPLAGLLAQLNYLGKRGSFMQLLAAPEEVGDLSEGFIRLTGNEPGSFLADGVMQMLDDCAGHLQFKHVNVYDPQALQLGKDRVLRHVVLPYRLVRSSQRYQLYRRMEG